MIPGIVPITAKRNTLEKRSFESLVLCNSLSLSNIQLTGDILLDVSKNGEYILASNKSNLCLVHTRSHLYNPLMHQRARSLSCSCDFSSIKYASAGSNHVLSRKLKYGTRCTSARWYLSDSSNFVTSGDYSIDVWDSSTTEIAYSFSNLPSLVNCLSITNSDSRNPAIAGGLSCGTISLCDTRYKTSSNFCKPQFSAAISVIEFFKHNENQLVAGYENGTTLVWDLRRFNRPLHNLSSSTAKNTESIIWGCTATSGPMVSKPIEEKHSFDFKTEDELWNYVKSHEKSPSGSQSSTFDDVPSYKPKGRVPAPKKRPLDLSTHSSPNFKTHPTSTPPDPRPRRRTLTTDLHTDLCTDIKISDVNFNIYISHKNGIIDCFNSTNLKLVKSFNVKGFLKWLEGDRVPKSYSQKMKIELICQDAFLVYNHLDSLGIINLRNNCLHKYIRMKHSEPQSEIPEFSSHPSQETAQVPDLVARVTQHPQSGEPGSLRNVTSITTIPSIRELYAVNEAGELFVLHPDYKKLFR